MQGINLAFLFVGTIVSVIAIISAAVKLTQQMKSRWIEEQKHIDAISKNTASLNVLNSLLQRHDGVLEEHARLLADHERRLDHHDNRISQIETK